MPMTLVKTKTEATSEEMAESIEGPYGMNTVDMAAVVAEKRSKRTEGLKESYVALSTPPVDSNVTRRGPRLSSLGEYARSMLLMDEFLCLHDIG
jgi:hypothetical protein